MKFSKASTKIQNFNSLTELLNDFDVVDLSYIDEEFHKIVLDALLSSWEVFTFTPCVVFDQKQNNVCKGFESNVYGPTWTPSLLGLSSYSSSRAMRSNRTVVGT